MKFIVNEDNYLDVIDHLNDFFSSQTREHVGIKEHWVRDEDVVYDGHTFKHPIFEERDTYNVFVGHAEEHPLKNERRFSNHIPLIALSDKYASSCICFYANDEVEIAENSCVILHDICGTQYTRTFYQMEYTEEELISHMNHNILDKIYDEFYEDGEYFRDHGYDNTEELDDISRAIQDEIWKSIKNSITEVSDIHFTLKFKVSMYDSVLEENVVKENVIEVTINREKFYNNGLIEDLFDFHIESHILSTIVNLFGIRLTREEVEEVYEDELYYNYDPFEY